MKVNIKGLINGLDSLRKRINYLFNELDNLKDLDQEDIGIEDVQRFFQDDDTFTIAIATNLLEQADKIDQFLEIIKLFSNYQIVNVQEQWYLIQGNSFVKSPKIPLTEEQAKLFKEVLL